MKTDRNKNGRDSARRYGRGGSPEEVGSLRALVDSFNTWRLAISIDGETVLKAVIIGIMMIVSVLLQTTMFTRFRPLGMVPDLMLPLTVAIGVSEREKAGAVVGLISAFIIDAVGGTTVMLLPLLYVPVGYICGLLTTYRLRSTFPVMLMYTVVTSLLRSVITLVIAMSTIPGITFSYAVGSIALRELPVNIVFAFLPHIFVRLVMRPFHKTRAERTGGE